MPWALMTAIALGPVRNLINCPAASGALECELTPAANVTWIAPRVEEGRRGRRRGSSDLHDDRHAELDLALATSSETMSDAGA